jgi:hypothetical protein
MGSNVAISCAPEEVLDKLRSNSQLRKYAAGGFAFCASLDRGCLRKLKNPTGLSRVVWMQLLMAAELFVVAREYSSRLALPRVEEANDADDSDDQLSKERELEADYMAALITAHIGVELRINGAHSGAAPVIVLVGTDMLRRAKSVLNTGAVEPFTSDTHPPLDERLLVLETLRYDPRELEVVRNVRQHYRDIMEGIWELILPDLKKLHSRGLRSSAIPPEGIQWMPYWA